MGSLRATRRRTLERARRMVSFNGCKFTALLSTGELPLVWRRQLVNLPLLPLNYLLEFGLFFLVARHKWRQHRESGRPMSREDLAMTIMAVISTLICTFLSSSVIGNNDL